MGYLVWRSTSRAYPLRQMRTRFQHQRKAAAMFAARSDRSTRNAMITDLIGVLAWLAGLVMLAAFLFIPVYAALLLARRIFRRP